ncbi:MAG: hypothetical protein E2O37_06275 [Proteobacteria bacterium]|nr:MAG: hypothetical protein E2O37_06275 [Pseudomonadota bacterium]
MKQNITLRLEKELIRRARVVAAKKDTSISNMLIEELARVVNGAERYEQAKKSALADLDVGFHFGGNLRASREELRER